MTSRLGMASADVTSAERDDDELRAERDEALMGRLEEFMPHVLRITSTPGVNVAIARRDGPIVSRGFGVADLGTQAPMTPETISPIGSIAKLYAAIALLQLVESRLVELDQPAGRYVPDLNFENPLGDREVTVHDLLTHRSGLGNDTIEASFACDAGYVEYLEQALREDQAPEYRTGRSRWTAKVGARYQYSTAGLAVVACIVEACNPDRMSFAQYVRRHIMEPLDMHEAYFLPSDDPSQRPALAQASGHARFAHFAVPAPRVYSRLYPSVGLMTTPRDQARLMKMLLNRGSYGDRRILTEQTIDVMTTPQASGPDNSKLRSFHVGLTIEMWDVGTSKYCFGHAGAYPWGWWSDARAYPDLDLVIVTFTNKWDMMRWHQPADYIATGLIADFVVAHVSRPSVKPAASWGWKASYAMGLVMVERLKGLLGIPEPLEPETIEHMATGVVRLPGQSEPWSCDEEAFRAGAMDMLRIAPDPVAISTFLDSADCPLDRAELNLMCLEFGRAAEFPVPMPFWAAGPIHRDP